MKSKKNKKEYDIIILGSGFAGLSVAYHLMKKSSYRVALASDPKQKPSSLGLCSMTFAGYFDNMTRLSHQWGEKKAKIFWKFALDAYLFCHELAHELGVSHERGDRFRFAVSEEEKKEIIKACVILEKNGFPASYKEKNLWGNGFLGSKVLGVQNEGVLGGWINNFELIKELSRCVEKKVDRVSEKAVSIENKKGKIFVTLGNGEVLLTESLVLCCHKEIASFLPELKEALVPYQDESHLISFSSNKKNKETLKNLSFSSFHGHIWGCFLSDKHLQLGGARFLRKYAGIGLEKAGFNPQILNYLLKEAKELFPFVGELEVLESFCSLEIRPSDELPIIGPMSSDNRIFLATGFMGQGLSLGVYSGLCLVDLILEGHCQNLPNYLLPKRFRKF